MELSETPLRRARKQANLTATELGRAVGVDQSTISRVERGVQAATKDLAEKLAKHLKTVSELEILYPERYASAALEMAQAGQRATA